MSTDENYQAQSDVVVISHRVWRDLFNADPSAIGRTVRAYQRPMTLVGVAAKGFNDAQGGIGIDLWLPLPAFSLQFPSFATAFVGTHRRAEAAHPHSP